MGILVVSITGTNINGISSRIYLNLTLCLISLKFERCSFFWPFQSQNYPCSRPGKANKHHCSLRRALSSLISWNMECYEAWGAIGEANRPNVELIHDSTCSYPNRHYYTCSIDCESPNEGVLDCSRESKRWN